MKTNRKFIVAFAACFLLYLLPEIFINDALLYLSGGVIGGTLKEVLRIDNSTLIFSIWVALIVALVFTYFYLKNRLLKYIVLVVIAFTLYIVDNLFASVPVFEMQDRGQAIAISYVVMFIEILLKSLILSWLYCKGTEE